MNEADNKYHALFKWKRLQYNSPTTDSAFSMIEEYDKWAEDYDKDYGAMGYAIPAQSAEMLMRHLGENCKSSKIRIMDIACGTGQIGIALRSNGFVGTLQGIDGSDKMISVAKKTKCYDDLNVQFIYPDKEITSIGEGKYDAVSCLGAFSLYHMEPKTIRVMLNLLKPGGIFICSVRDSPNNQTVFDMLTTEMKTLANSGLVKEIERKMTRHGVNWEIDENYYTDVRDEMPEPSIMMIYCLQKL
ncbi:methyltransferase-like protein 27 [Styela clava]